MSFDVVRLHARVTIVWGLIIGYGYSPTETLGPCFQMKGSGRNGTISGRIVLYTGLLA